MAFTTEILVIIANMLEEKEITATYKSSQCKMPCYNCMVLRDNLNNIDLELKNMLPRTLQNMQSVLKNCVGKNFSMHNIENTFWNFL